MGKQSGTGTIITMFSARGSTGKTTIAINLAVALAQETGQRVALVDLDVRFGDVWILLDIPVERSLVDLVTLGDEITMTTLEQCVYAHKTGVSVLPASTRPSEWRNILAEHAQRVVSLLAETYDYVVLDTASTFNDIVVAELKMANVVLLVTTAHECCLNETRQAIDYLGSESLQDKTKLIMNATNYATDFEPHGIEEILGQRVLCRVPHDRGISTMELGTPLVISNPDSEAARGLTQLARLLTGETKAARDELQQGESARADNFTVDEIWGEPSDKAFVPAIRMHRDIFRTWIQLREFPGFDWNDLFETVGTENLMHDPEWHITFHANVQDRARDEAPWGKAFEALVEEARAHQATEVAARHTAEHALLEISRLILVARVKPEHEAKLREAEDWLHRCAHQDFPETLARIVRRPVSHDYRIVMRRPG